MSCFLCALSFLHFFRTSLPIYWVTAIHLQPYFHLSSTLRLFLWSFFHLRRAPLLPIWICFMLLHGAGLQIQISQPCFLSPILRIHPETLHQSLCSKSIFSPSGIANRRSTSLFEFSVEARVWTAQLFDCARGFTVLTRLFFPIRQVCKVWIEHLLLFGICDLQIRIYSSVNSTGRVRFCVCQDRAAYMRVSRPCF